MKRKSFGSDNHSGIHPDILEAIAKANSGDCVAYGEDAHTERAIEKFREHFGSDIDVYFVFNGTGANTLALKTVTRSFNAVIAAETAHINVDECGAPENFTGCKIKWLKTPDGKLTPELMEPLFHGRGDQHHVQPKVISITQTTELGTAYTVEEIKNIANFAHSRGMLLHIDGARIANAAVGLGLTMKEITSDCGADILSFGGTKNGMGFGEAVIFFNKALSADFMFVRKQGMQLASKMRFISAQFEALLSNELWLKNARHSNSMAKYLEKKIADIQQLKVCYPVEANALFVQMPKELIAPLQKEYFFYVWDEDKSVVRWMTSFNTTEKDIDDFTGAIEKVIKI